MAFKKNPPPSSVQDSPDKLFLDLPRRKFTGLLDHQGQILRTYAKTGAAEKHVALQLPTGSGKTLVGLLIAEWRRRRQSERTVYLCPTKQLVNQVVEEARAKYGIDVDGFTGRIKDFDAAARTRYVNADRVAVTTYSALFNTNPFFKDPHLIVIDDAHAAENYIAALWTVRIDRAEPTQRALFDALSLVIKPKLEPHLYTRLTADPSTMADRAWVDKLPTPILAELANEIRDVITAHSEELELRYSWSMITDHVEACQFYLSATEFFIRPLIPPTWTHAPFARARQRVFMSATLGAGGDLERLTGCRGIKRLAIPEGWDKQGIGRRFFVFPGISMGELESSALCHDLMRKAGRSLVLVPSDAAARRARDDVENNLGFQVFSATDIEETRTPFVENAKAVAIVANRYDGIDFPGDDCRLQFIEGLPKAVNLQERFLMARMTANLLLNERVQTRVLQAVGRCTRGLNDYSAVVVKGEELGDYLISKDRRPYLHPELQAELEFGVQQSQDVVAKDILDNFGIFLEHDSEWEAANEEILAKRAAAVQKQFPAIDELQSAVSSEIQFQERMWQKDYEHAFDEARAVLGSLAHSDLKGYRALWHYLAGAAAWLSSQSSNQAMVSQARDQFAQAKEAARGIPWLVALSRFDPSVSASDRRNAAVMQQVERLEVTLESLGKMHNRGFERREKEILEGLADPARFENAQLLLGETLGFVVGKEEVDGSPDPWWICADYVIVFEDHAGALSADSVIDTKKARQAASHVDWVKHNVPGVEASNIIAVLVSPAMRAAKGAVPSLMRVSYWQLDEFRHWAKTSLGVVRELRASFSAPGDIDWRIRAAEAFEKNLMDAPSLQSTLAARVAGTILTADAVD
jgi:hypothetical protein